MEPPTYQRKWETLLRSYTRLHEYYFGKIDKQDSFNGPKDFVYSYFHATYSLKEALKKLDGMSQKVETFIVSEPNVALGIDISNSEKHGALNDSKSQKLIGKINSHLHIFDPQGKDRTELTIEIDGDKVDCLNLASKNKQAWEKFLSDNKIDFK